MPYICALRAPAAADHRTGIIVTLHGTGQHHVNRHDMESFIWPGPLDASGEDKFREQLLVLSSIAAQNTNGVVISDAQGCVEWVNPAYEKITGYSLAEMKGIKPGSILQGPGTDQATVAYIAGCLARKDPFVCEILNYHKSGRPYWVRISGQALKDGDGNLMRYFALCEDITELKNARKELEKLSLFASTNRLAVHFTDAGAKITYVNEALLRLTGYTREEVLGKTPSQLFHGPLTNELGIDMMALGHRETVPVETDIILYKKDRSWFWANVKKQPLSSGNSDDKEFFSIIEDITERKLSAERLRNSENRLATLIRNMKEGILLEDENRRIVLTNQAFCSMFGIPADPDSLTGTDCSNSAELSRGLFLNPDAFVHDIHRLLANRRSERSESLELADGRFFERDYIPILFGENLVGHLWKYEDITIRKKSERTLLRNEEKYRNIIANMKLGMAETDTADVIVYVNQEFCEMSGYTEEELLGKKSVELLVADESQQIVRDKSASRKDGISDTYEVCVRTKNGDLRWWLTSGGPNHNDRGEMVGTVGISLDITEQKAHEAELRAAREKAVDSARAKETFLASMSHEIRTPLNAIIGLMREIAREPLSPKQERYIRNAGLASQHLLSIVNDVLDITKIESGQLNLESRTFAMQQLIDNTAAILTPEAVDKNLDLTLDTGPGIAPAYIGDGNRIKQVLLNILNNAIKFTDKGSVHLECTALHLSENLHRLSVRITDTGIGMEPDFLNHIFEKFTQGEASTARRYGGTGLGLSITHELVQLMGGRIEVESTKGEGTTFTVTLDLETGDPANLEPDASTGSFSTLSGRSVLLVEDNDLNRLVAENTLTHCGMRVTGAHNGAEALEILKERRFDIILMDLQMPVMNGLDATLFLRREMEIKTPVIALTANAFKAELDRCLEAGMNDYITKPFEESVLLASILRNIGPAPAAAPRGSLPTADGEPLYNLDYIVQFSRDNPEFVRKMVNLFIEQVPASVDEIREALAGGDLTKVAAVAHRIKPNIDSFGIVSLKQEIRDLEARALEKAPAQELKALADHVGQVIGCVVQQLKKDVK